MAKEQAIREPGRLVRFYRETMGELRKVVWPTRQETMRLTVIVLVVIVITAIILGTFDFLFAELFRWLISLK